jgi:gentisate 1,2-dioxygenase
MAVQPDTAPRALAELEEIVRTEALEPLWAQPAFPAEPVTAVRPYRWRWSQVRPRLLAAGALQPLGKEGADRRVLAFKNPGLPMGIATTQTLSAAVQLVHATERAPSHRHTPAAIRFVIEGRRTYTLVNGEPCWMEPGDLILTPNWSWHGHVNEGDGPMIWLDALDVPLVFALNQMFFEDFPGREQPVTRAHEESLSRYGLGSLRPTWVQPRDATAPLLSYKWTDTEPQLRALAQVEGSPFDGVALEYTNPVTGGPALPTLGCRIQLLRPGEHTRAHRHTASAIYHVVRGHGVTTIAGERLDWAPGDVIALPSWAWHAHENASGAEEAILFSVTDEPVLRAVGLYREQEHEA